MVIVFGPLRDYSDLMDLHVYGDLLTLYSMPVYASIAEAGRLYNDFSVFERRILTLYVSYVSAKAGFYASTFASDDFAEECGERLYTTEFSDKEWIENFDLLPPSEGEICWAGGAFVEPWDLLYENRKGEKLGVVFVEMLFRSFNLKTGREKSEAEVLVEYIENNKDLCRSERNIIIAHPWLSRSRKEDFLKTKTELKKLLGRDIFLSTGEFVARFIPEKDRRAIVEENWKDLRAKLLASFQSKYPFLTFAINRQKISDAEAKLRSAMLKYEEGRFEDAIKDAAVACEELLQVLCSKYGLKTQGEVHFYDLQCILRDIIIENFGENTYSDLDMIREWRNRVVHPSAAKPDSCITLQIVRRTNLFFELFKRKTLLGHSAR